MSDISPSSPRFEQERLPDPTPATATMLLREVAHVEDKLLTGVSGLRGEFEVRLDAMDVAMKLFQDNITRVPTDVDKQVGQLKDLHNERFNSIASLVPALRETVFSSRELVEAKLIGNTEVITQRLAGMDKAIELLQKASDMIPMHIKNAVDTLKDLHSEKFSSIETQFIERDKRTEQLSLADKTAIAAALQAQKEAAGATTETNSLALNKMEGNFSKLIEQLQTLMNSDRRNMDDKLNDLKSRFDRGEGRTSVSDPAIAAGMDRLANMIASLAQSRDQTHGKADASAAIWGYIIGGVGIFAAFVSIIFTITRHV